LWGSLGWNVSLGKEASEERVLWALEIAGLSDLVVSLPEGLRTPIGPKGVTLSRGETQRLMIARCIYDLPDIVILDEATASLDDATEKRVLSNLMGLPNTPTVIMCSHKKELQHLFHRTICLDSQIGSISSLTQDK
jgi:ABC-type bacteriocin/lantibiotic exporter with double-glycine peptidase domain